jgi:PAS domain S-box-containing protein/diguanylate cyclase (GGDEF)-like protein
MELEPEVYKAILESLPTAVYVVDRERKIVFWNDGAESISGYHRHEAIGRCCSQNLMHCDENDVVLCQNGCPLQETMHDGKPRQMDVFLRHKDGQRVPVRVQAVPLRNENGAVIGAIESFDEREAVPVNGADTHRHGSHHTIHSITELPDRQTLRACIRAEIEEFLESHMPFSVLSLHVDDLAEIQRVNGRVAVANVLGMVARTLSVNLGPNDVIGRWTDEHFVIVIKSCASASLIRFAGLLKRLVRVTAIPWWGDELSVTVSMGGTVVRPGDTPETMIERAEQSLETAADAGGDRVAVAE